MKTHIRKVACWSCLPKGFPFFFFFSFNPKMDIMYLFTDAFSGAIFLDDCVVISAGNMTHYTKIPSCPLNNFS